MSNIQSRRQTSKVAKVKKNLIIKDLLLQESRTKLLLKTFTKGIKPAVIGLNVRLAVKTSLGKARQNFAPKNNT
jgi:hypothetical protein